MTLESASQSATERGSETTPLLATPPNTEVSPMETEDYQMSASVAADVPAAVGGEATGEQPPF